MDSWLIRQLWKPDLCMYVDVNSAYSGAETSRLEGASVRKGSNLQPYEREDFIIPYRNVYLILNALNEYEKLVPIEGIEGEREIVEIALGATAGDRVLDKSPEFAKRLSALLTYLSQPQHWTGYKSREVRVVLPYKKATKRQLLRKFKRGGGDLGDAWRGSFSCYTPDAATQRPCGKCKACFRKTVAFTLEGYIDLEYISKARDYILESGIWNQIVEGTYGRAEEEKDIKEFMESWGNMPKW